MTRASYQLLWIRIALLRWSRAMMAFRSRLTFQYGTTVAMMAVRRWCLTWHVLILSGNTFRLRQRF